MRNHVTIHTYFRHFVLVRSAETSSCRLLLARTCPSSTRPSYKSLLNYKSSGYIRTMNFFLSVMLCIMNPSILLLSGSTGKTESYVEAGCLLIVHRKTYGSVEYGQSSRRGTLGFAVLRYWPIFHAVFR